MLPENEVTEFENRAYVNPQLTIDEGDSFINKLRSTQQANNQQIKTQTYNLGKAVPSNLGGLVGGEGYWTSRYQTPAMNTLANDLRTANRKIALERAMQNDIAMWQNRYNTAKRAYQSRLNGGGSSSGGNNGGGDDENKLTGDPYKDGIVDTETIKSGDFFGVPDTKVEKIEGGYQYTDPSTGAKTTISDEYLKTLYDENGNLTDEGAVILNIRNMWGL